MAWKPFEFYPIAINNFVNQGQKYIDVQWSYFDTLNAGIKVYFKIRHYFLNNQIAISLFKRALKNIVYKKLLLSWLVENIEVASMVMVEYWARIKCKILRHKYVGPSIILAILTNSL